jgi:phosphate/sulfate permease
MGWISTSWSQFVQLCFASLVFFTQGVNSTSAAIGLVVVFSIQTIEAVFAVRNRVLNVHYQKIKTDAVTSLSLSFFVFVLFYFDVSFTLNNKAWHSGVFQPFMMVTLAIGGAHCLMILILFIGQNCFDRR